MADAPISRTASVLWLGDFARGAGEISAGSGQLHATYSFDTRFSASPGTNPEELVGAALASCFTMAFALVLGRASSRVDRLHTKATVRIEQLERGYEITSIHLSTVAEVAGVAGDVFTKLADEAKTTCPMARALFAVPITLDATQVEPQA